MEKEYILPNVPQLHCSLHSMHAERHTYMRGEHIHTECEIIYVLHGSLVCSVGTQQYRLFASDMCIVPGMVMHRLSYDDAPADILYLQMDTDCLLEELYPELPPLPFFAQGDGKHYACIPKDAPLYGLLLFILGELRDRPAHYEAAVKGALVCAVVCMQRECLLPDVVQLSKTAAFQKILPALRYAGEHISQKIDLSDMCRTLGIDKYNFCKYFKRGTGMTFFEYLSALRLRQAQRLLSDSAMSVSEIALACGYSSAAYFHRVFVCRRGCTPSKYRSILGEQLL